jgi:2,4-dienoyl-CoA reductase-like NADH-dependent reductase (Old Yellow Enzyme family)
LDLLNVSVNFVIPDATVPWGTPAFLAPVAERVRREAGLPVAASWGIDDPQIANRVVTDGQMDLVMIGRAFLANPHYPYQMAQALGVDHPTQVLPAPYAYWLARYRGAASDSAQ